MSWIDHQMNLISHPPKKMVYSAGSGRHSEHWKDPFTEYDFIKTIEIDGGDGVIDMIRT